MAKAMTFARVQDEAERVSGAKDRDDVQFKTAAVLMSSAVVGPDEAKLAEFTGYDRAFIDAIGERLRKSKVWHKGKIASDWFGKDGDITFNMDVCVALGWMKRGKAPRSTYSAKVGSRATAPS